MIKKKFKLKGEEIKKFFQQKLKKINCGDFVIFYQKNTLKYPRIAVVPKKEIFRQAVKRNKIKRRIYAIIEELLKNNQLKNYDILIFPQKTEILNEDFNKLKEKIKKCLSLLNKAY